VREALSARVPRKRSIILKITVAMPEVRRMVTAVPHPRTLPGHFPVVSGTAERAEN